MVTGVARGLANEFAWVFYVAFAVILLFVLVWGVMGARSLFLWAMRRRSHRHS